jgi:hypothetical protein
MGARAHRENAQRAFVMVSSKAENGPTAALTLCTLNQSSFLPMEGTHMKGSTFFGALFATVFCQRSRSLSFCEPTRFHRRADRMN